MIYLDYNATAPVHPQVVEAMLPYLREQFGNASSAHRLGSAARCAVEDARDRVAALVGAHPREIIFTSGGTESNNLAIQGIGRAVAKPAHVVTTAIEHSSVLEAVAFLERKGWRVTRLGVDREGRVRPEEVVAALRPDTKLVTIAWANNEIGTIQPIVAIRRLCGERGVRLHVDAVQAVGKIEVGSAPADLLSCSAHKLGGPKGVGALVVRNDVELGSLLFGGPQERGRRAGTENVAGIVGFGAACELASRRLPRAREVTVLREQLWQALAGIEGVGRNSPPSGCLCNTLNVSFGSHRADALVAALDLRGVAVSSGSACAAGASEPSHVLRALGRDEHAARDAIRFSLGFENTRAEIEAAAAAVREAVKMAGAAVEAAHA